MTLSLTKNTIDILKNFAQINQGITVKAGSQLRTMSVAKNIMAEAEVDEQFPINFSIYDLNEFLAAAQLFKEPVLDFGDKSVVISEASGRNKVTYFYSEETVVISPPDKKLSIVTDVTFRLSNDQLASILKACSILQVPDIKIVGDNGILEMIACDMSNPTSNSYSITLDDNYNGIECAFHFKAVNFKMINDSYTVNVSTKGISQFVTDAGDLQYWIALEKAKQ